MITRTNLIPEDEGKMKNENQVKNGHFPVQTVRKENQQQSPKPMFKPEKNTMLNLMNKIDDS